MQQESPARGQGPRGRTRDGRTEGSLKAGVEALSAGGGVVSLAPFAHRDQAPREQPRQLSHENLDGGSV